MMTDFAFAGFAVGVAIARCASSWGSVSPPRPIAPARSHSRRLRRFASSGETSRSIAWTPGEIGYGGKLGRMLYSTRFAAGVQQKAAQEMDGSEIAADGKMLA